MLTAD